MVVPIARIIVVWEEFGFPSCMESTICHMLVNPWRNQKAFKSCCWGMRVCVEGQERDLASTMNVGNRVTVYLVGAIVNAIVRLPQLLGREALVQAVSRVVLDEPLEDHISKSCFPSPLAGKGTW